MRNRRRPTEAEIRARYTSQRDPIATLPTARRRVICTGCNGLRTISVKDETDNWRPIKCKRCDGEGSVSA